MKTPTNVAASVRQRLLNLAQQRGEDFNVLLSRFAIERLLYRVGVSPYRDNLLLKGAALFAVWEQVPRRPTRDVDFLGIGQAAPEHLTTMFQQLCVIECPEDGITFNAQSIEVLPIRAEDFYGGHRVRLEAHLESARIRLQIDVGFGDAVTPGPRDSDYPSLLPMLLPPPHLKMYPPETVVAEKWQAMVELGLSNSRMKDFYDVWLLSRHLEFDGEVLARAVRATFERRQTPLPQKLPVALCDEFCQDAGRRAQWRAFTRKSGLQSAPELSEIVREITAFLWPLSEALNAERRFGSRWIVGQGWSEKDMKN